MDEQTNGRIKWSEDMLKENSRNSKEGGGSELWMESKSVAKFNKVTPGRLPPYVFRLDYDPGRG